MSDPHIDIDEVDNPQSSFNNTAAGGTTNGFNPNLNDFATGFFSFLDRFRNQSGFGMGTGFDPIPYESRKHFRSSQREFLLGWRTLIDENIRRLDERDLRDSVQHESEPVTGSPQRGSSVKIEVEEIED